MSDALKKRLFKAFAFSVLITVVLYATGYENYKAGNLSLGVKIGLAVFLRFLIFFGILTLASLYRPKDRDQ